MTKMAILEQLKNNVLSKLKDELRYADGAYGDGLDTAVEIVKSEYSNFVKSKPTHSKKGVSELPAPKNAKEYLERKLA